MVRHREDKPSPRSAASDPLAFLNELPPEELARLDETVLVEFAEQQKRDLARKLYGIPEYPEPQPLSPEDDCQLMEKAFERTLLPRKVRRLEREVAEKDAELRSLTTTAA